MIRDFRTYDSSDEIACDLCIAGAGAAGITLARAFAGRRERVIVLAGGGFAPDAESTALYQGTSVGMPYHTELDSARVRVFGGSTAHWEGMCALYDRRDFLPRPWVDHYHGWPIERSALDPYYEAAHPILDLGRFVYDPRAVPTPGPGLFEVDDRLLADRLFRFSPPVQMGEAYQAELEQAENISVLLHAHLVEIELAGPDGPVAAFAVRSLDGKATRVRARVFVLALGGIENPRMLLASNRVVAPGIGNARDLVGRFFMEHFGDLVGTAVLLEEGWQTSYLNFHDGPTRVRHALAPANALLEEERILNIVAMFGEIVSERMRSPGYTALRELKDDLAGGRIPVNLGPHLWDVLTDLSGVIRGIREKFDSATHFVVMSEQAPNPDSRVRLGTERDALGMPRPVLDWRLSEIDKRTVRVLARTIARELGRLGLARLQLAKWLDADATVWSEEFRGSNHHIGTTRMADHPSRGVVDPDGRVFGVPNLFVAGSSVFPTSGFANPTLTVVAMALRLADHLAAWLEEAPPLSLRSGASPRGGA